VVERDGIHFAPTAVEAAGRIVARLLVEAPDGVTVSGIRDALGTSRKYAMPLIALLDAAGMTRRRGDLRIAGPLLPLPD
jgi:selenocysteine-specific elongation factor